MSWHEAQNRVDHCRCCDERCVPYLKVPVGPKRHPPYPPQQSTRLFFVSVAPPYGGSYFWDETRQDDVREGLFLAIAEASGQRFASVPEFLDAGYFLVPGVKCPSEKDGNDHKPSIKAIKNCTSHLSVELEICRAERLLAFGGDPMKSVSIALEFKAPRLVREYRRKLWWRQIGGHWIPAAGTYFPGNNRHQGFQEIVGDIGWILDQEPRSGAEHEMEA